MVRAGLGTRLRRPGAAVAMLAVIALSACGGTQAQTAQTPADAAQVASRTPVVNPSAPAASDGETPRAEATVPPTPTLASTATQPPPSTATPSPTATSAPPTATPTPTLELVWRVVGECEFDPPTAEMQPGGNVTFVNATGSEIDVSLYLPDDAGIDGGGIEPGEASDAYEITLAGRTIVTCDFDSSEKTTFGALIVAS